FSSRRRHTRSDRDWSSDVCSSDLAPTCKKALRQKIRTRCTDVFQVQSKISRVGLRERSLCALTECADSTVRRNKGDRTLASPQVFVYLPYRHIRFEFGNLRVTFDIQAGS